MRQPSGYSQEDDLSATLARAFMRRWLPFKERRRQKLLKETFDVIKEQAIRAETNDYKALLTIMNIALFFLIAERDIQSIKIDALTHPDKWTRKLHARVILLTIHEWDMDKVSGGALRSALETVGASEEIRKEAIEALRAVRLVQRKAKKEFGSVRNATIAHRESNALLQYRMIDELKTRNVFELTAEFYKAAHRYVDLMPHMMSACGTIPALLKQWKQSQEKSAPKNAQVGTG